MSDWYVGLMSGTSLDGVDGVLVNFGASEAGQRLQVRAHVHRRFEPGLAAELLALNARGDDELHRAALAANALARVYAEVVGQLLQHGETPAAAVRAVGAHGQTVRHRPREFDATGYTLQLNNPALLAELCGIDVVADLRSRDVAAGGQGAPLVPPFHAAMFGVPGEPVAVLNLGGIANLTLVGAQGDVTGFDCGPANALLDLWCESHTRKRYDAQGRWAAAGTVIEPLLAAMLSEPYFALPPPKSTGRDRFHRDWLDGHLRASGGGAAPVDVQATLSELTAAVCAQDLRAHAGATRELLVCGGGAFNDDLLRRLSARLAGVRVTTTDRRGLPADQVEACAFAWLARAFVQRERIELGAVTGAAGARTLGALYPAR